MKKFAEINSENLVIAVIVAENISDCKLSMNGVRFIETFSDGTNGQDAGMGFSWNEEHQIFCQPQLYSSWTLDNNLQWQPPTPYPNDGCLWTWSEETLTWIDPICI